MSRAYTYTHRVTFAETNLVGNVYFAEYARWQGACRESFLFDHAPAVTAKLQAGKLALVTVTMSMRYYAESFAGDEIHIQMRARDITAQRVTMSFDFIRGGDTIASGDQMIASLERTDHGLVPCQLPTELSEALARFS